MTYNMFGGTLNLTQSVSLMGCQIYILLRCQDANHFQAKQKSRSKNLEGQACQLYYLRLEKDRTTKCVGVFSPVLAQAARLCIMGCRYVNYFQRLVGASCARRRHMTQLSLCCGDDATSSPPCFPFVCRIMNCQH